MENTCSQKEPQTSRSCCQMLKPRVVIRSPAARGALVVIKLNSLGNIHLLCAQAASAYRPEEISGAGSLTGDTEPREIKTSGKDCSFVSFASSNIFANHFFSGKVMLSVDM